MKQKTIFESFDARTGVTTITIQNKYGTFTGKSTKLPCEPVSTWEGSRNAYFKAELKFLKSRLATKKKEYKLLNTFYNTLEGMRDTDVQSAELKRFRKELTDRKDEILALADFIAGSEKEFVEMCNTPRETIAERLERKHQELMEKINKAKENLKED